MIAYILMFICAIIMIWANTQYKKKGAVWGRPVAGVFGALAICFAFGKIIYDLSGCAGKSRQKTILNREMKYTAAQYRVLGDYFGKKYDGESAVLLTNAVTEWTKKRHNVIVNALKQGLDGHVDLTIKTQKAPPAGPDGAPPMDFIGDEFYLTAKSMEEMMGDVESYKLVITSLGLPFDYQKMKIWKIKDESKRQKLVLLNADIRDLKLAFERGFIAAAVITNPKYRYDDQKEVPENYKEVFDERYLLITPENFKEMGEKYSLFGDPTKNKKKK